LSERNGSGVSGKLVVGYWLLVIGCFSDLRQCHPFGVLIRFQFRLGIVMPFNPEGVALFVVEKITNNPTTNWSDASN